MSDGVTAVYLDGEWSTSETELLYQLHDGRFEGYSDGDSISGPLELPNRVAIFMAGTQPTVQSSSTAAMVSGSAATAGGPARRPAQVLADLLDDLTALLTTAVTPETQVQHNADVTKLKGQITQAKADLVAEEARMDDESGPLWMPNHN